jgi:hypothetical protein
MLPNVGLTLDPEKRNTYNPSPSGELKTSVLRHSDIPSGSEALAHMTSFPLSVLPDHQPGLFLRANLPYWQIHLHLPVLEQFQQHTHTIGSRQAGIEDGFISCERAGMDDNCLTQF